MGHPLDHKGFQTRKAPIIQSAVSVLSGVRLAAGAYHIPLPGHPGVWYCLTPGERANLTDAQLQAILDKGDALFPKEPPKRGKSTE